MYVCIKRMLAAVDIGWGRMLSLRWSLAQPITDKITRAMSNESLRELSVVKRCIFGLGQIGASGESS